MGQEAVIGPGRSGQRRRTKTGCITCRIRRVKCDETRPTCNRCAYSKRVCDGYLPLAEHDPRGEPKGKGHSTTTAAKPLSRRALALAIRQVNVVGPAMRVLAPSPYLADDVACFDFFRLRLTAVSADPRDSSQSVSGFWNCTLLQAAHLEPAVWQAVAALGALYRRWEVVSGGGGAATAPDACSRRARLNKLLGVSSSSSNGGSSERRRRSRSNRRNDDTDSHSSTPSSAGSSSSGGGGGGNYDHNDDYDYNHDHDASVVGDWNEQSVRLANQAGTCYSSAMRLASSIQDPSTMLVLSLALAAAANLSGRWVDSSVHFRAGQRIMTQLRSEAQGKPIRDVEMHAAESLARLGVQWLSFGEKSAPPPRDTEGAFFALPSPLSSSSEAGQHGALWGLHRAHIALIGIFGRVLSGAGREDLEIDQYVNRLAASGTDNNDDDDGPDPTATTTAPTPAAAISSPTEAEVAIVRDLEAWEESLIGLLENNYASPAHHPNPLDLLALKLLHTATRLLLAVNIMRPDYSELGWDSCLGYFERILALVALVLRAEAHKNPLLRSVMSLDEPAINVNLWLTAHRCRHPILRRRALALLRGARRLEGVWMSTSAAAAAAKVIEIEERGRGRRSEGRSHSAKGERGEENNNNNDNNDDGNNTNSDFLSSFDNAGKWPAAEAALLREIEAEDPRSWLGPLCARRWASESKVGWGGLPGDFVVPLRRRVASLDVLAEYDPRVGRSRAELVLCFADRAPDGHLRRETLSVYF